MNDRSKTFWWMTAMVAIAAAGIFQVIDQPSMTALTVVLLVTGPWPKRCRLPGRNA
jgi:hypothetical protein